MLGRWATEAKLWPICKLLEWTGRGRKAVLLRNAFKALCVQNSFNYNRECPELCPGDDIQLAACCDILCQARQPRLLLLSACVWLRGIIWRPALQLFSPWPATVSLVLVADLITFAAAAAAVCCCCCPAAGSIVSSVDNCKALQQRIAPAEQSAWPLVFDPSFMDWDSYG
jgi:hypothetical protein